MAEQKARKTKKSEPEIKVVEKEYARLHRSEKNKMIAGVAGGLAEYFAVDPVFVRIVFILLTLFHGSGALIYFILWIILPTESKVLEQTTITGESVRTNLHEVRDQMTGFARKMHLQEKNNTKLVFGGIVIVLGILFLLDNFGLNGWLDLGRLWPIILIVLGFAMVF